VLAIGTAIQLLVFYDPASGRQLGITPWLLLSVMSVKHLLVPLLGAHLPSELAGRMYGRFTVGKLPILPGLAALAAWMVSAIGVLHHRAREPLWLFTAASVIAAHYCPVNS